jgi:hypothetical protein
MRVEEEEVEDIGPDCFYSGEFSVTAPMKAHHRRLVQDREWQLLKSIALDRAL